MHYRWDGDTLYLDCTIQSKAREDRVSGLIGESLKIRITAAPADGKANRHLIRFLSGQFRVKQSAITIVNGLTSRQKRLRIDKPVALPDSIMCPNSAIQSE